MISTRQKTILIDSNVLLDVVTADPVWGQWSSAQLALSAEDSELAVNAVIFAEVSVRFTDIDAANALLKPDRFLREDIPFEAAFLAGKAFAAYRRAGGPRTSLLPDFLIGAHASVRGCPLLTRDPRRYRSYFPDIALISP